MEKIKLFDSFAGIGSLHKALKRLNIPIELVGLSEIDIDAILSYSVIHLEKEKEIKYNVSSKKEMQEYLINRNIGYDFKKEKSKIPSLSLDKLTQLYKVCVNLKNYGDISLINTNELPNFDLFNFSFPCTDISIAGKQQGMKDEEGNSTRSGLYVYGINIIKNKKPKYIMIENVKNLISKKFIDNFYEIVNELENIGYTCYYPKNDKDNPTTLNAKDYGVPQNRERVFVICVRKDIDKGGFKFPKGFDNGIRLKDILEYEVDEKFYISQDKTDKLISQLKDKNSLLLDMCQSKREGHPREYTDYAPTLSARDYKEPRLVNRCISNNELIQVGELDIKGMDCIKRVYSDEGVSPSLTTMQGGNREPKVIVKEATKKGYVEAIIGDSINLEQPNSKARRGRVGQLVAQTLTTSCNQATLTKEYRIRKLTPKECWRLMGFEDEDIEKCIAIGISNSQLYKLAGNSIVVDVLYYIFKNLFKDYIV